MKNRLHATRLSGIALAAMLLGACATHYHAGSDRGVYYERPEYRSTRVAYVDPLVYPYWSLDYFYYSRYYHPFSVVVHRFDPWYYPYPGWYYGYWPGPRYSGYRGRLYYPWHRFGNRYAGYRPWHLGIHFSFGYHDHDRRDDRHRVHELDARLRELETRRSLAVRSQRPDRQLVPAAAPWLPATSRGSAIRRDDRRRPPPTLPGPESRRRSTLERQALIDRLRAADRGARLPERSEPVRDRRPAAPPRSRDVPPRRDHEPAPPTRTRPVDPRPTRSRPQRRPDPPPAARGGSARGQERSERRERQ